MKLFKKLSLCALSILIGSTQTNAMQMPEMNGTNIAIGLSATSSLVFGAIYAKQKYKDYRFWKQFEKAHEKILRLSGGSTPEYVQEVERSLPTLDTHCPEYQELKSTINQTFTVDGEFEPITSDELLDHKEVRGREYCFGNAGGILNCKVSQIKDKSSNVRSNKEKINAEFNKGPARDITRWAFVASAAALAGSVAYYFWPTK